MAARCRPIGGVAPSRTSSAFCGRISSHAHGAAIPAETRVNPDGTLDITDWPRPAA